MFWWGRTSRVRLSAGVHRRQPGEPRCVPGRTTKQPNPHRVVRLRRLRFRNRIESDYADILPPEVTATLAALAPLDSKRRALMRARIERRAKRFSDRRPVGFLAPDSYIEGTDILVSDARKGFFLGAEIPADLNRPMDPGNGARSPTQRTRRREPAQRCLCHALRSRWLDV